MSTMKLDDFLARIDYDEEREVFHGRIINIRDVVNFYGKTPAELKQEFRNSLDCYLEVCAERGLEPAKPYSGRFNIRMSSEEHRLIAQAAEHHGESINAWARKTLDDAARRELDSTR